MAVHFGADLVRLVDSPDRCGVWVRPRPERLELCLDYVDGGRLIATAVFFVAATMACVDALERDDLAGLPPAVLVSPTHTRERSGWHLARNAFVGDPFGSGARSLRLQRGAWIGAGRHLELAWSAIRPNAAATFAPTELAAVDAIVDGWLPDTAAAGPASSNPLAEAFGSALRARARRSFEVAPVAMTWSFAVFLLLRQRRRSRRLAVIAVPRRSLAAFQQLLDAGALDKVLEAYLRARPQGRVLGARELVQEPGLYDAISRRRDLLAEEFFLADSDLQLTARSAA